VSVYVWKDDVAKIAGGYWDKPWGNIAMGQEDVGEIGEEYGYNFGQSVDISDDGSLVAVRAATPSGSLTPLIQLYSLDGLVWKKHASDIEDEMKYGAGMGTATVSLSGDGKYVAIGAEFNYEGGGDEAGHVRVFKDPTAAASSPASPSPIDSCSSSRATGGSVTTDGDYTIHTFTSGGSGTFTVVDADLTEIDVLVVGGGGGGSHSFGGGGGGGEVGYVSSRVVSMQSYSIYVAHGGSAVADTHGEQSSFDDIQAVGGRTAFDTDGRGGSSGIWPGGAGGNAVEYVGGGGGGASGSGGSGGFGGLSAPGGNGGAGKESDITGHSMYYGGGGGGNSFAAAGGAGGLGGGGSGANMDGGSRLSAPEDGSPNTGGGGGGDGYNAPGDGGSGVVIVRYTSPTCNDQSCGTNYYHDGSDCVACPTGSTRMPDTANQCLCPENHHRSVDGGVYSCAACAQGSTRLPGDTVPGGDSTTCTSSVSPPPPPPSAQALEKVAEETRDSILADIADERSKAKVKLLADAAIAGTKVQRLTAKMSAADEDTACSNAFTGAGMSAGDGACVATAASSEKRRRLHSTMYDVELMFSSATVSDDALTMAVDALKTADGVTSVTSQASVDPITELKTVPGVDTSKLQTFDTQAQAAVAAALTPPPPSIPPPAPPPPPKPNLVLDDDDAAVGLRGWFVACVAAMLVLVLVV
jgi:hypothetical protein